MTYTATHPFALFGTADPAELFNDLTADYQDFFQRPTRRGLFPLVGRLVHLNEMIQYSSRRQMLSKPPAVRTLNRVLGSSEAHRTLRKLYNRIKHWRPMASDPSTDYVRGARMGLMACGDSLDQEYFLVNNADIRSDLMEVYIAYRKYFMSLSPQIEAKHGEVDPMPPT